MNDISSNTNNVKLLVEVSSNIYDKDAILSACYKFSGECFCNIDLNDGKFYIELQIKNPDADLNILELKFKNELIDQQVRINVNKEFRTIREEIVKKAFSSIS